MNGRTIKFVGLSNCRTIEPSDYRTRACRTIELSDYRTVGLSIGPRRITYELQNVGSMYWCWWNIATYKWEVDCWKSEVSHITFVIEFCTYVFNLLPFRVKFKVRSRRMSVSSILYLKLIWIDDDNHRIENCSVTEHHHLYCGSWN